MSFICFDTEDNSKELLSAGKSGFDKTVTQIAAMSSDKKFYNKGNVKEFLQWLKLQPEQFLYAHNLQYDLGNLFGDKLDTLDCTLVGGRIIKAVWGKKVFVDSFNIWPMSAKVLGKAFGLEKLEFSATSKEYVYRDVEIIYRAMSFAWDTACNEFGLDKLPPTLGGLCVKAWKSMGGTNCHDSNPLSKAAYFGGRVELFRTENATGSIAYTDVNSLYPSVMRDRFPGPLQEWTDESCLPYYGVAKVTVEMPKTKIGALPYRNDDGRILYPYGTFTGTWTMPEIFAALKRGGKILKRWECWGTVDYMIPYGTFVAKCYKLRQQAKDEPQKLFYKLLMNNLYGRLGTGGEIGRTVFQTDRNCNEGVCYGSKVLVNYKMPLSEETNWIHAAYVTAYGRLKLLEYIETIGVDKMIYCDTDSCIFDCPDKQLPFETGNELGQMKLESWETCCQTFAPKMYRAGDNYKAKGVPKHLAKEYIQTGRAEFDLPFKLREAIRFYDRQNSRKLSVWRRVEKINHVNYDKKVLKNSQYFPCKINCPE